jgi:hypothetical protein
MMPPCGTYDYVATTAANPYSSPWDLALREPVVPTGSELSDKRLVGYAPKMRIEDLGLRPDTPEWQNQPSVMLSKVTLTADSREHAQAASVSFFLDSAVINALHSGDRIHLSRTASGGLGISAIRDKQLIFALGAVTAVPLGDYVKARIPMELINKAEEIFRKHDRDFEFPEYPLEIQIGNEKSIMYRGRWEMNGYVAFVLHGNQTIEDGGPACAAISLKEACSWAAANASAELLDHGATFGIVGW